jgi:hypothetical protein
VVQTTVPPSAPAAISALNLTVTTLPPSMTTIFSPQQRLGSNYDTYQNEINYGRAETNATDKPNITVTPAPLTTPQPIGGGGAWWNPFSSGSSGTPQPIDGSASVDAGVVTTTTTPSQIINPSTGETSTDAEFRNESALDCQVGEWTEWGDCHAGGTEGIRSWHETRYRPVTNPHYLGGLICVPRVMRRPCPTGGWSSQEMRDQYGYTPGGYNWNPNGGFGDFGFGFGNGGGNGGGSCNCNSNSTTDASSTAALIQEDAQGTARSRDRLRRHLKLRRLPQASGFHNNHEEHHTARDAVPSRADHGRLCLCAEHLVAATTSPPM